MSEKPPLPAAPLYMPSDRLWFDPRLLNSTTTPQITDMLLPSPDIVQLVGLNPRRWALGFALPLLAGSVNVAPWPDVDTFLWGIVGGGSVGLWFTLFNYGPLVSNAWFGTSAAVQTLRIVELIRN